MDSVRLSLLQEQLEGLAEEMGTALARSAFSPNIRVRRDFSCALFSARGELLAQAAHIPVHLGSMPRQVRALVQQHQLHPGDTFIGNDPYNGGTHLPDITLLQPVFSSPECCVGVVAVRAHHADVGGPTPGSMGSQREIYGEGLRIPLTRLGREGEWDSGFLQLLLANMRAPREREGDLLAQRAACRTGSMGLSRIFSEWASQDPHLWRAGCDKLLEASRQATERALNRLFAASPGPVSFSQLLECGDREVSLTVSVSRTPQGRLLADFQGSSEAVASSVNATIAVTEAALAYTFCCLTPERVPINQGMLDLLEVRATEGSVLSAAPPQPVAAGNVETSQRVVDLLLGAFQSLAPDRVPAAAAGTMNNLSFSCGGRVHYETSGGGYGGHPEGPGASALQVHMTNTRSTPTETLEEEFPITVLRHTLRSGSGGAGQHPGGEGTVKELRFERPATVTLLSTRRTTVPYGVEGGEPGQAGAQSLQRPGEAWQSLPASFSQSVPAGTVLRLETPGGGGWGAKEPERDSSKPSR